MRLAWRKNNKLHELELYVSGMKAATVSRMEVQVDFRWAWRGFLDGRFGGPKDYAEMKEAKAAAETRAKSIGAASA